MNDYLYLLSDTQHNSNTTIILSHLGQKRPHIHYHTFLNQDYNIVAYGHASYYFVSMPISLVPTPQNLAAKELLCLKCQHHMSPFFSISAGTHALGSCSSIQNMCSVTGVYNVLLWKICIFLLKQMTALYFLRRMILTVMCNVTYVLCNCKDKRGIKHIRCSQVL